MGRTKMERFALTGLLWVLIIGWAAVATGGTPEAGAGADSDADASADAADADSTPAAIDDDSLADLDLSALLEVEITSVSRKAERLADSAAAVYVISQEDLRRSGATSIPEALRMVPGLHVAQLTGNRWVVASRGFSEEFNNKLLVLIDGRSVYTPLFSGVYWDAQDTLLEDIDRIEVIRGPGATVWGANAVNGVINIITKKARDTQGAFGVTGWGNQERFFSGLRYGGSVGDDFHYRVYAKYFDRDDHDSEVARNGGDAWNVYRGGFRADWSPGNDDTITFQGDYYDGNVDWRYNEFEDLAPLRRPLVKQGVALKGWNGLARWTHTFSETSDLSFQTYWDHTERPLDFVDETRDTFDFDLQHRFQPFANHDVVWGLGYRNTRDEIDGSLTVSVDPGSRVDNLFSGFVQDQIQVIENKLILTFGSKFEHNDYTGFEYQPSGRILYRPNEDHAFWGAISRAVRTPSRVEDDLLSPFMVEESVQSGTQIVTVPTGLPFPFPPTANVPVSFSVPFTIVPSITGTGGFDSEKLLAYELGYRFTPSPKFSLDIAAFYNQYDDLRTLEPGPPDSSTLEAFIPGVIAATLTNSRIPRLTQPGVTTAVLFGNRGEATSYGVEVAGQLAVTEWWDMRISYSFFELDAKVDSGSADTTTVAGLESQTPTHQLHLRSNMDLPMGFELDTALYYTESIINGSIPTNVRVDLRVGWQPREGIRLSVVGQNLFDSSHAEFEDALFGPRSLVNRSVYGKVEWAF